MKAVIESVVEAKVKLDLAGEMLRSEYTRMHDVNLTIVNALEMIRRTSNYLETTAGELKLLAKEKERL
jgi:hypothetical protein